jgi:uncharacterized membrane protein HdeD (DUF308 family)
MLDLLVRHWWATVLRGLIAVLFGLCAFFWPGITLTALVWLFGAYALLDGLFALAGATLSFRQNERWWVLLLEGLLGVAAAVVAFVWPGITAVAFVYVMAFWAIVTGVFEIIAAIRLRGLKEGAAYA